MTEQELKRFMDRVETLTGHHWCPYPTDLFVLAAMSVGDGRFVQLINKRRCYTFFQFVCDGGESQSEDIVEILFDRV